MLHIFAIMLQKEEQKNTMYWLYRLIIFGFRIRYLKDVVKPFRSDPFDPKNTHRSGL